MIIYNTTVKVEHEVADAWVSWMKTSYMPEHITTGLFTDYRLCKLLEQDEADGITYIAQYFCEDLAQYETYMNKHAEHFRQKGFKQFGSRILAFRTIMEVI